MKKIIRKVIKYLRYLVFIPIALDKLKKSQEQIALNQGILFERIARISCPRLTSGGSNQLHEHEFKIFSQGGDDGIIKFLTEVITLKSKVFVEFGVQDYVESNTRYLLMRGGWSGLVIDGSLDFIRYIQSDPVFQRFPLTCLRKFIDADNINEIISAYSKECGPVSVLSIDIDGNDYWIWKAITSIDPEIVVIEYNHRLGFRDEVTIPYDKGFVRGQNGLPIPYYGASLAALCFLGQEKGYSFIGCNSYGNNAYFVKTKNLPPELAHLTPEQGYVRGQFRELRLESGELFTGNCLSEGAEIRKYPWVKVRQ